MSVSSCGLGVSLVLNIYSPVFACASFMIEFSNPVKS